MTFLEELRRNYADFIKSIEFRISELGIDLSKYPIDHVAFRVSNSLEYKDYFQKFKEISVVMTTKFFHERSFNMFVLKEPLLFNRIEVQAIEFAEPGGSDNYNLGFQHIEIHSVLTYAELFGQNDTFKELLFISKHGDEEYIKWPDKTAFKIKQKSILLQSLTEDSPVITVL